MNSLIVMGVAGCGKSSVGRDVAALLGLPLIEGDDFHLPTSVGKMKAGVALEDADRAHWLDVLVAELARHPAGAVLTCSALKRSYRERMRVVPGLRFVHLQLSRAAALQRVAGRGADHLFPPSLVDSQFNTLEAPEGEPGVLTLDATLPLADLVTATTHWMKGDSR
jgi:gluconokinase